MASENEPRVKRQFECNCPKCKTRLTVSWWRQTKAPPSPGEYEDWAEATVAEQQELPGLEGTEPNGAAVAAEPDTAGEREGENE